MRKYDLTKLSGADLEARIKDLAISVKPERFEQVCEYMQILLDEQNARAKAIAKKHKKFYDNRTVADVFKHYWLAIQIERSKDEN